MKKKTLIVRKIHALDKKMERRGKKWEVSLIEGKVVEHNVATKIQIEKNPKKNYIFPL